MQFLLTIVSGIVVWVAGSFIVDALKKHHLWIEL